MSRDCPEQHAQARSAFMLLARRFGQSSPRPAPRVTGTLLTAARMGATLGQGIHTIGGCLEQLGQACPLGCRPRHSGRFLSCPAPRAPGAL
eukprot:9115203-Alexandrium_andersonii.AAC.1